MHGSRALVVAAGLLILAWSALLLRERGPGGVPWLPGCVFRKATGFECPGCGMTRASHAALNGDLAAAFAFNPLGMVLLPLALLAFALELEGWIRGRPPRYRLNVGPRIAWGLCALILIFWVGRNVV